MSDDQSGRNCTWLAIAAFLVPSILGVLGYVQKQHEVDHANAQLAAKAGGSVNPTTKIIGDATISFDTGDPDQKRLVLRGMALRLRSTSPAHAGPPPSYGRALPEGTDETSTWLSDRLKEFHMPVDLSLVDLHGHFWRRAYLAHVLLRSADLRAANLTGAQLDQASLQGAALECAQLNGASAAGAGLDEADLTFADLRGVDLSASTGLTVEQLSAVDYDAATVFPATADPRRAGVRPTHYPGARTCAKRHLLPASQGAPTPEATVSPESGSTANTPTSQATTAPPQFPAPVTTPGSLTPTAVPLTPTPAPLTPTPAPVETTPGLLIPTP